MSSAKMSYFFWLHLSLNVIVLFQLSMAEMLPSPHPYDLKNPDGTIIRGVRLKGRATNFWEETSDGFPIQRDKNGYIMYATKNERSGRLESTNFRVDTGLDPVSLGIPRNVVPTPEKSIKFDDHKSTRISNRLPDVSHITNLVVRIRFSNHATRELPSSYDITNLFNSDDEDSSVKKVFERSSYGKLIIPSIVSPIISLPRTERYYADRDNGFTSVLHEGLRFALDYLDNNRIIDFSTFDTNNDNWIDAITFLHSGFGAEFGGTDCYDIKADERNRIWSHKHEMSWWTSSDGVRVSVYHISPMLWGTCNSEIGRIGVIAHETGHFFGLPDLYDYGDGNGIGSFGLMANSWGFDGSQFYPPIMSAWSKQKLGWITCEEIKESGYYTLDRISDNAMCYIIARGFQNEEYLLIENRQPHSFDSVMPQGGLVIFRIEEGAPENYFCGHPDSPGWPENGNQCKVAVLQADGRYDLEKAINRGDHLDPFHEDEIRKLVPSNDPLTGPFPNTDSYKDGIRQTGISIVEIGPSSYSIRFGVFFPGDSFEPGDDDDRLIGPLDAGDDDNIMRCNCVNKCQRIKALKRKCAKKWSLCGGCAQCKEYNKASCQPECFTNTKPWSRKCKMTKCIACRNCQCF